MSCAHITARLPKNLASNLNIPDDITLADSAFDMGRAIDILLRVDSFWT